MIEFRGEPIYDAVVRYLAVPGIEVGDPVLTIPEAAALFGVPENLIEHAYMLLAYQGVIEIRGTHYARLRVKPEIVRGVAA